MKISCFLLWLESLQVTAFSCHCSVRSVAKICFNDFHARFLLPTDASAIVALRNTGNSFVSFIVFSQITSIFYTEKQFLLGVSKIEYIEFLVFTLIQLTADMSKHLMNKFCWTRLQNVVLACLYHSIRERVVLHAFLFYFSNFLSPLISINDIWMWIIDIDCHNIVSICNGVNFLYTICKIFTECVCSYWIITPILQKYMWLAHQIILKLNNNERNLKPNTQNK